MLQVGPDSSYIALIPYSDRTPKDHIQSHADARLIAAAPDMLVALKAIEKWWLIEGMHHHLGAPYAIFATREAIAKAEGTA